ncbi:MAG: Na(+)-translocating NADH-quinone reductase subunit C [Planctomycetota bacterium]
MPPRDSWQGTFVVALVLCLACSALVSTASVVLRPTQEANAALDKKKNVLLAAGLADPATSGDEVQATFEESIVKRLIDLETGKPLSEEDAAEAGIDPEAYDPMKAVNDPALRVKVTPAGSLMGSTHREPYAEAYEIVKDGQTDGYILPIYGMGLWGKLYGFIAVEGDGDTVRGITYYKHKETPGLGGEVDNPGWKALWPGKKIYEQPGEVGLGVIKGSAAADDEYAIDGLSGATITSKGVDNMVKYWLGEDGFGPYLAKN